MAHTYEANWSSLRNHLTPQWLRDDKFGIYTHWGVYSVPACGPNGSWYPHNMYREGNPQYDYHAITYGPVSEFGYKDFIPMFKAEKFDAEEWGKDLVVTYKFHGLVPGTALIDYELGRMDALTYYDWITDTSVDDQGAWSYVQDAGFKKISTLVDNLIDNVSKNGYLLLNVGPKSDGTIPDGAQRCLVGIGEWSVTKNGLEIDVPDEKPCQHAFVFKITRKNPF